MLSLSKYNRVHKCSISHFLLYSVDTKILPFAYHFSRFEAVISPISQTQQPYKYRSIAVRIMRYNQFMQYLETRQQDNLLYFLHSQSNQGKDRLDKDWNFTKSWACPTFSRFNAMPVKITKKILWLVLPDEIC